MATFTSNDVSTTVFIKTGQVIAASVSGTFSAKVSLERDLGGGNYKPIADPLVGSYFADTAGTYRLRCYNYVSGTVTYTLGIQDVVEREYPGVVETYSTLPPASSVAPGTTAYTTDAGMVVNDGENWFPSDYKSCALRCISVAAIGDSNIANGMKSVFDLQNAAAAPSAAQIANAYASGEKYFAIKNILLHGSLRSNGAWFPFEFSSSYTNGTSQMILDWVLPAFLANPYGLPDACLVLAGSNDVNLGGGTSFVKATTLANLRSIYERLISSGVTPIACTIPPRTGLEVNVQRLNVGIMRLAKAMNIPLADIYSALVSGSTGTWASSTWNTDTIHFSSRGAAVAGYVINQTLSSWFRPQMRTSVASFDSATLTEQIRNGNFTAITGTINTSSSYPSTGWNAPGTVSMSTVYNSSGTEPGSGKTMRRGTPAIGSGATTPNYIGQAWALAGNGTNTLNIGQPTALATTIGASTGDKIAITFRIKVISNEAAANPLDFIVGIQNGSNGHIVAGILGQDGPIQIGGETGYDAGDFYMEYTCVADEPTANLRPIIAFRDSAVAASNIGDYLVLANLSMINLSDAGVIAP